MNPHLQRGQLLYEQSRYDLAEAELRQGLADEPDDSFAHALLALCLTEQERFKDATDEARQAIHLAPDFPFAHYALARILYDRDRYQEAQAAIEEAIRLDPEDADYRSLLSAIHLDQRRWPEALAAAEQGLQLDAEHVGCTNLRAMALVKLGRKQEAGATIDAALAKNPENAITHANQGWTLLEHNDAGKALEHFREALRLDPENEWARQGIVEALKARNLIYALMLRYFLWMSKLSQGAQWGIILTGYFANRLLSGVAKSNPDLAPWLLPLRILYIVFVLLTWTASPVFNLMLRLNKFGRLSLSREQITESNWLGACLLLGLLSLGACFVAGFDSLFLLVALVFGALLIPLAGTFNCRKGWPRTGMWIYTGVMAATGLAGLAFMFAGEAGAGQTARSLDGLGALCFGIFLLGAVGSPWVANALMMQRPKR